MIDDKECKIVCSWLLPGPDSWKRLKSWLRCKGVPVEEDKPEEADKEEQNDTR